MGIFSGEKEISVDSVVYNLAGDEINRPHYLKSLVARNVLSGTKDSIAQTFQNGYLKGPAIKFRQLYRWASKAENYGQIGLPTGSLAADSSVNPLAVEPHIPRDEDEGEQVIVQRAELSHADYGMWVEQWFLANEPGLIGTNWSADMHDATKVITITLADGTTRSFTATGFDLNAKYIYAWYNRFTTVGPAGERGVARLFIYRIGSGIAELDQLVNTVQSYGQFFPVIPVRLDNQFVNPDTMPTVYEQARKAYRKATGSSIDELIDKVADNPDLGDIDFTYVVFGVSLNVLDNSARKYLYRFFEKLQASQVGGPNLYAAWKLDQETKSGVYAQWQAWKAAQSDPEDPLYGTPEPERPTFITLPQNDIAIVNTGAAFTNYNTRISWVYIANGQGVGKGKVGAKRGELWFEYLGTDEFADNVYGGSGLGYSGGFGIDKIRLYWQRDDDSFTYLDIVGLIHRNYIYGGKGVMITAREAIQDTEESGFIIPLHYDTYREVSLVDSSQMATACVFVVFNCYEVKKRKWYESGIFQILLVIVIAIASTLLTGGAGLGILGAHMAVGSALGLSGMTAAIVGSVANALAALVLVTIVSEIATDLFGPVIGGLITAIFGLALGSVSNALHGGGTFGFNWGDLLKADNLLKITSAVGNIGAAMVNQDTLGIQADMQDYLKNAEAEAHKIQQAFFEQFGYGAGQINPLMFVDSTPVMAESSDTFLTRTLMTGSEIAEMSRDLLYNFSEYTLKLPDAFS